VPEARHPVRAGRRDADGDELLDREGQHHVQLDPEREGDLRDDDVGAAGERAVREADAVALQLFAHLGGHAGLLLVREARARARRRRHVAAEMDDLGLRQHPGDGFRVQAERRAEKAELAAGGGLRAVVVVGQAGGGGQGGEGAGLVAEDEQGFRPRGPGPVKTGVVGIGEGGHFPVHQRQDLARQRAGEVRAAGHLPPGRGVDAGVGAAEAPVNRLIGGGRRGGQRRPLGRCRPQRMILGNAGGEGGDVLGKGGRQVGRQGGREADGLGYGPLGTAGTRQREHSQVFEFCQDERIQDRLKRIALGLLRRVVGCQILTAPDQVADRADRFRALRGRTQHKLRGGDGGRGHSASGM
jgi:hypothetical protein